MRRGTKRHASYDVAHDQHSHLDYPIAEVYITLVSKMAKAATSSIELVYRAAETDEQNKADEPSRLRKSWRLTSRKTQSGPQMRRSSSLLFEALRFT